MKRIFCKNPLSPLKVLHMDPVEKTVAIYKENKKLYERLIQAEKDKVSYLEELLKKN